MRRAFSRLLALLIVAAAASVSTAGELPTGNPSELEFSAARLEYLDHFYAEEVKRGELAGMVILISRHGKIAHFSAIGSADQHINDNLPAALALRDQFPTLVYSALLER